MTSKIKTYNPALELNTKVVALLRTTEERLDLLARIAYMGVDGYSTQTVTNKGAVVDIIKHDLASSIRAVQAMTKIIETSSASDGGSELTLVINPTNPDST